MKNPTVEKPNRNRTASYTPNGGVQTWSRFENLVSREFDGATVAETWAIEIKWPPPGMGPVINKLQAILTHPSRSACCGTNDRATLSWFGPTATRGSQPPFGCGEHPSMR